MADSETISSEKRRARWVSPPVGTQLIPPRPPDRPGSPRKESKTMGQGATPYSQILGIAPKAVPYDASTSSGWGNVSSITFQTSAGDFEDPDRWGNCENKGSPTHLTVPQRRESARKAISEQQMKKVMASVSLSPTSSEGRPLVCQAKASNEASQMKQDRRPNMPQRLPKLPSGKEIFFI